MLNNIDLSGLAFAQCGIVVDAHFVFRTLFSRYNLAGEGFCSTTGRKITCEMYDLISSPDTSCPYKSLPERLIYDDNFSCSLAVLSAGLEVIDKRFVISKSSIGVRNLTLFEGKLAWALNGCESLPGIGWLMNGIENDFPPGLRNLATVEAIRESAKNVYPEKGAVIGFVTSELVGAIEFRQRFDKAHYSVDVWALPRELNGSKIGRPDKLYFPLDDTGDQTLLIGELR